MTDKYLTQSPAGEFVMFASDDGEVRVECRFEQETLWLPQATIANLYQPSLKETTQFFQTIQNKLHFACTGHTAAELIHLRADASQPHMGLTSYKGEEVRKGDVTVAKNYLTQDEVSELNRVVNMWLDFAEDQARRRQQVFLRDWQDKLDQFLQFNDREVLQGAGKISKKMADEKAQAEYGQFAEQQRRLKEAEGEKDIAGLLQWKPEPKK